MCTICIDGQWVTPSDPVYHWQTSTQLSSNSMDKVEKTSDGRVYSILPAENYNLIHTRWEDDIIWDPDVSTYSIHYSMTSECILVTGNGSYSTAKASPTGLLWSQHCSRDSRRIREHRISWKGRKKSKKKASQTLPIPYYIHVRILKGVQNRLVINLVKQITTRYIDQSIMYGIDFNIIICRWCHWIRRTCLTFHMMTTIIPAIQLVIMSWPEQDRLYR